MGILGRVWYGGSKQYAAAILYLVDAAANAEIWLQDADSTPVLITTLPKRVPLGWSHTGGSFTSSLVGYVRRPSTGFSIDDVRTTNAGAVVTAESYKFSYDGPYSGGQSPTAINFFLEEGESFYAFLNGSAPEAQQRVSLSVRQDVGVTTITLDSISNYVAPGMTKTPNNVFISLRVEPYHDEATFSAGDIYNSLLYWNAGTLTTFLRSAADIPEGDPLDPLPLDYVGAAITDSLNSWAGKTYDYLGDLQDLINGGVVLENQPLSIDGSVLATMSIRGVTAAASRILAVRVVEDP